MSSSIFDRYLRRAQGTTPPPDSSSSTYNKYLLRSESASPVALAQDWIDEVLEVPAPPPIPEIPPMSDEQRQKRIEEITATLPPSDVVGKYIWDINEAVQRGGWIGVDDPEALSKMLQRGGRELMSIPSMLVVGLPYALATHPLGAVSGFATAMNSAFNDMLILVSPSSDDEQRKAAAERTINDPLRFAYLATLFAGVGFPGKIGKAVKKSIDKTTKVAKKGAGHLKDAVMQDFTGSVVPPGPRTNIGFQTVTTPAYFGAGGSGMILAKDLLRVKKGRTVGTKRGASMPDRVVATPKTVTEGPQIRVVEGMRSGLHVYIEQTKISGKWVDTPNPMSVKHNKPIQPIKPKGDTIKTDSLISQYMKRFAIGKDSIGWLQPDKFLNVFEQAMVRYVDMDYALLKTAKIAGSERLPQLVNRFRGAEEIARSPIFWKTTRLADDGNLVVTGPGLQEIIYPARKSLPDLISMMDAQRNLYFTKRVPEMPGLDTAYRSRGTLKALRDKWGPKYGELGQVATELRKWGDRSILQPLRDVGYLSTERYAQLKKGQRHYTPWQRLFDEMETAGIVAPMSSKFIRKRPVLHHIKGSERTKIDPLESWIQKAQDAQGFVTQQQVVNELVGLRGADPMLKNLIRPAKDVIAPIAKVGEETIFRPHPSRKNMVETWSNGSRSFWEVHPDIYKAVQGMNPQEAKWFVKAMSLPARTLRTGATLSLEFLARNPLRDQWTAWVYSKYGYRPVLDLGRGLWEIGKERASLKGSQWYKQFNASGASHATMLSLDRKMTQATLADVMRTNAGKKIAGTVINPFQGLRMFSDAMERGTRVGAYRRAVMKGATHMEAMMEARTLTLDFNRMGLEGRALNQVIAFWNANVQGVDKMRTTFTNPATMGGAFVKAVAGITVPTLILWDINKDEEWYKAVPQWQKDMFWLFKHKEQIYRVPKPFELGIIFGSLPERLLEWRHSNDPEGVKSTLGTLARGLTPGVVPSIAGPIVEQFANKDLFRGRPIETPGMKETMLPHMRGYQYTGETSKLITKRIHDWTKGKVDVSPIALDHMIRGYGAGLATTGEMAVDAVLQQIGIVDKKPEIIRDASTIPLLRAFAVREPVGPHGKYVKDFYDVYSRLEQEYGSYRIIEEQAADPEGPGQQLIDEYLAVHPEAFAFQAFDNAKQDMSALLAQRRYIQGMTALPESAPKKTSLPQYKADWVREIDLMLDEIAKSALYSDLPAERSAIMRLLRKNKETP